MPHGGQDQDGACGDEAEEEDYDYGMLVVHEVVAEARAAAGDAAIGELDIEAAEEGGYVDHEEAVQKAYRGVPALISIGWIVRSTWYVLPEGWQAAEEGDEREERDGESQ